MSGKWICQVEHGTELEWSEVLILKRILIYCGLDRQNLSFKYLYQNNTFQIPYLEECKHVFVHKFTKLPHNSS